MRHAYEYSCRTLLVAWGVYEYEYGLGQVRYLGVYLPKPGMYVGTYTSNNNKSGTDILADSATDTPTLRTGAYEYYYYLLILLGIDLSGVRVRRSHGTGLARSTSPPTVWATLRVVLRDATRRRRDRRPPGGWTAGPASTRI